MIKRRNHASQISAHQKICISLLCIRTKNLGNIRLDKAKRLSEQGLLTWGKFQDIFGDAADEKLEQLAEDGQIDLDEADEVNPLVRSRFNETRLEIEEENGDTKVISLMEDTHLRIKDTD